MRKRPVPCIAAIAAVIPILLLFGSAALSFELEQRVQSFTLENGLKVLIQERHLSPTVSLYIRHDVGAVDEISGRTGTAHFLEHLLFKGTRTIGTKDFKAEEKIREELIRTGNELDREKRKGKAADGEKIKELARRLAELQDRESRLIVHNEIDRLYTENGGTRMNASTGQDITSYFVSLPSNKIELWARIESERMREPIFREFYSERSVIMEERRQMIESLPERKLWEQFLATAFTAHPYRRPIIGWPSDIANFNYDFVREFYRTFYAPNNTVIAVAGDVSAPRVMEMIRKYFGGIPAQKIYRPHITEEPVQSGERRVFISMKASPRIAMGWHKPPLPSFDDTVFDIIEALLSRGRTSRFQKRLVEGKNIAERIDAANGFPGSRYPNLFVVYGTPRGPHSAAELEKEILAELEKLRKEPVAAAELEKVKNQIRMDYLRDLDSNEGLAGKLSYFEVVAGDYRYIKQHLETIERITPKNILEVANRYLKRENRTVAVLGGTDR
ncbi:MAG: pitrilysin family protein [Syntrophales bacterium]|nr:pitrilysin family protein [Syntrophales bacterium]MDD5232558.1 pitrilysin family protein [Syntrophales bacterium]MDD5532138.1 pitrilysin family protein [Syntrophales bacterium]